jgi:hypothetical protein
MLDSCGPTEEQANLTNVSLHCVQLYQSRRFSNKMNMWQKSWQLSDHYKLLWIPPLDTTSWDRLYVTGDGLTVGAAYSSVLSRRLHTKLLKTGAVCHCRTPQVKLFMIWSKRSWLERHCIQAHNKRQASEHWIRHNLANTQWDIYVCAALISDTQWVTSSCNPTL